MFVSIDVKFLSSFVCFSANSGYEGMCCLADMPDNTSLHIRSCYDFRQKLFFAKRVKIFRDFLTKQLI